MLRSMKIASYNYDNCMEKATFFLRLGHEPTKTLYIDWLGRYAIQMSKEPTQKGLEREERWVKHSFG